MSGFCRHARLLLFLLVCDPLDQAGGDVITGADPEFDNGWALHPSMPLAMPLCDVAFVFVGHARSFHKPSVHRSILRHLIGGFGGEHCSPRRADSFWVLAQPRNETPGISAVAWRRLERMLRPRRIVVHGPVEDAVAAAAATATVTAAGAAAAAAANRDPRLPPTFHFHGRPSAALESFAVQASKLASALVQVRSVEEGERGGRKYRWLVRCRFDGGWYASLPPAAAFPPDRIYAPMRTWNGVGDSVALVPRHLAESYFALALTPLSRPLASCNISGDDSPGGRGGDAVAAAVAAPAPPAAAAMDAAVAAAVAVAAAAEDTMLQQPESLLWAALARHGAPFSRFTFPFAVVGADGGDSKCPQVSWTVANVCATMWWVGVRGR